MDRTRIMNQIKRDEGLSLEVYLDTKGLPTVGVGHLVLPCDNLKVGDVISQEQSDAWLEVGVGVAIHDCHRLFKGFDSFPEVVQEVLVNMAYNLGFLRLSAFAHMRMEIEKRNWNGMAREMADSHWAQRDVPNRAKRLIAAVQGAKDKVVV